MQARDCDTLGSRGRTSNFSCRRCYWNSNKVAVETATNVVGAVGGGAYRAVKNLTKRKK